MRLPTRRGFAAATDALRMHARLPARRDQRAKYRNSARRGANALWRAKTGRRKEIMQRERRGRGLSRSPPNRGNWISTAVSRIFPTRPIPGNAAWCNSGDNEVVSIVCWFCKFVVSAWGLKYRIAIILFFVTENQFMTYATRYISNFTLNHRF